VTISGYLTTAIVVCSVIFIPYQLIDSNIDPVISLPSKHYSATNAVCANACKTFRALGCREWSSLSNPRICEFACDTFIDTDGNDNYYRGKFVCATNARTYIDVQSCKLSCTKVDDL